MLNLLDLIPPELIPFITKYLLIQDLKNCCSLDDIWKTEAIREICKRLIVDCSFIDSKTTVKALIDPKSQYNSINLGIGATNTGKKVMENTLIDLSEYYDSEYSETESEFTDSETESEFTKARVGIQKVNCYLNPGFLGPAMCIDKLLKKIGGKISRKLTPEEKDSKFIREEATAPLGLVIIPLTFTSNIKDNIRLNNEKSITILTEILVEKYTPKMSNYILLDNNWFYDRKYDDDELQIYISEIVTDTEDAWVRTTLRIKDLNAKKGGRVIVSVDKKDIHDFYKILPRESKDFDTSNSDTSDSNSSNSSTSSSEIEVTHAHKTRAVKKHPILKRKVK
ncbi:11579_t:CDS:2, partial [Ambispora gerdemannii]